MDYVKYDFGYMFFYSERPNTYAARKLEDDIPEVEKKRRLTEIIQLQSKHSLYRHEQMIGKTYEVLVEGTSKKSEEQLFGRVPLAYPVSVPKSHQGRAAESHHMAT